MSEDETPGPSEATPMVKAGQRIVAELGREMRGSAQQASFWQWFRNGIRTDGGILPIEPRNWVLVKHWHDAGGIQDAYGPYTKERADWLLAELAGSSDAWTATQLRKEPEL